MGIGVAHIVGLFEDATEDMPFTDPVAQEITKRTGITLSVEHPVAGDSQAIPLMMASGEYPDLIFAKGELTKLIDAGPSLPLTSTSKSTART